MVVKFQQNVPSELNWSTFAVIYHQEYCKSTTVFVRTNWRNIFIIRSAYPVFKQCLKRSTSDCPSDTKKLSEGILNASEFMCNYGLEGKKATYKIREGVRGCA